MATIQVRWTNKNNSIESAGPSEGTVEMPGSISRSKNKYAIVRTVNAIHFGEELVDKGLTGRMSHVRATRTQCIDFIKEQNTGCAFSGQFKDRMKLLLTLATPHIQYVVNSDR